jgi:hypothetical protein
VFILRALTDMHEAVEPSVEEGDGGGADAAAAAGSEAHDGASRDGAEHGGDAQDAPASSPPGEHAPAAAPVGTQQARTSGASGACPVDSERHPEADTSAVTAHATEPSDTDESWMRPELDITRLKKESPVEVRSDGEWWYRTHFRALAGACESREAALCPHRRRIPVCADICARGGDREAVIQDIDIEKNQIHVHYIGGSEDEDEWVPCEPQRVQLHPMIEILWAKVGDGPVRLPPRAHVVLRATPRR